MSSARRGRYSSKKSDPLNKRIPDNPRYSHVRHVVDTGSSLNSYMRHLDEIKQNYRYQRDEIFKRLKVTTFAQLVLQVEMYEDMEGEENISPEPSAPQTPPTGDESPPNTSRSTLSGVISGMGEMDVKATLVNSVAQALPPSPPPYLLLDVRDREDYEQAHIITAKHYPPAMLSRSCNNFTKDILEYRNKPGKIIIIYDEDERIAPRVATTFIQKEIDNIFLLSGGMKVLHKIFPGCMITGQIPSSCLPSPPQSSRGTGSGKRQPLSSSRSQQLAAIAAVHTIPHVGSRELKEAFTVEDLDKMEAHLDNALLSGSSRASSRSSSSASTSSVASSRVSSRATTSSSTPWKY